MICNSSLIHYLCLPPPPPPPRDLRQEVTVLAQLSHPNIVALLGVAIRPMCMVIEYAPMGSLFGILDKKVEQFKAVQADRASAILRMPGGVLGYEISSRISLQVRWVGWAPLVQSSWALISHGSIYQCFASVDQKYLSSVHLVYEMKLY